MVDTAQQRLEKLKAMISKQQLESQPNNPEQPSDVRALAPEKHMQPGQVYHPRGAEQSAAETEVRPEVHAETGVTQPEQKTEQQPERSAERPAEKREVPQAKQQPADGGNAPTMIPANVAPRSATYKQVESILEEGLEEAFQLMDPALRQSFKLEGEITTSLIEELVQKTKATFQAVFNLIQEWLKKIPQVNKFFLEQQAKIKTDKIMALAYEKQKSRSQPPSIDVQ